MKANKIVYNLILKVYKLVKLIKKTYNINKKNKLNTNKITMNRRILLFRKNNYSQIYSLNKLI